MRIDGRVIWQQAAGDTDRNYAELCLKWGVILNGPGSAGPWPDCQEALRRGLWSPRKISDLRRFAEAMQEGDLVALRLGTSCVVAVGTIVGTYAWHDEFGDVDGWDLQHVRRIRWHWRGLDEPMRFNTYALKQGDTTQPLAEGPVKDWIATLPEAVDASVLPTLPTDGEVSDNAVGRIAEFLFDQGVASGSIARLLDEIDELVRIAKWYQRAHMPSEHETVAYLVVPLLRALGWTPQRMAVEWNRVDVALFEALPRSNETLRVVVEAKKMDKSCLSAMSQALAYSQGKTGCHRLIVTDGLRYGVYVRDGAEQFQLYAYLNLARLRHAYAALGCKGAEYALLAMAPEWSEAGMSGLA